MSAGSINRGIRRCDLNTARSIANSPETAHGRSNAANAACVAPALPNLRASTIPAPATPDVRLRRRGRDCMVVHSNHHVDPRLVSKLEPPQSDLGYIMF